MNTGASAHEPRRVIPIAAAPAGDAAAGAAMQRRRRAFQAGFFALFVLAPVFDLWASLGAVALALVLTVGLGLAGTWRVLGAKAAPVLRNL